MNRFFAVLTVLLVASVVFAVGEPLAQQQPAPGAAPGAAAPAGQEKSVEGKIKSWDAATNMLTLEDGTQISIPVNVKERAKFKQGASVKASYSVTGGKNVATSIQVQ